MSLGGITWGSWVRATLLLGLFAALLPGQIVPDSVLTLMGCIIAPLPEAHQDLVALDSARIRVIIKRSSPGNRDSVTGTIRWCPTREIVIAMPRDTVWLSDGRPFLRRDPGISLWVRDTMNINFAYASWRAALTDLLPLGPVVVGPPIIVLPPVVVTPPTPTPIPPIVTVDACNAAPWHWQTLPDGTRKRDDTMTPQCRAIVTLTDTGRYAVAYAPCGEGQWTYHPALYATRASAITRAKSPPACLRATK